MRYIIRCDLSADIALPDIFLHPRPKADTEEIHHLGDGSFGGHIVAEVTPAAARRSPATYRLVCTPPLTHCVTFKYHYAAVNGALYGMNEPRRGRRVAGSERAEHNTFYPRSIEGDN